jgi:hypothetical protein
MQTIATIKHMKTPPMRVVTQTLYGAHLEHDLIIGLGLPVNPGKHLEHKRP